eukprot:7008411-Prymnesium_polylepis.2
MPYWGPGWADGSHDGRAWNGGAVSGEQREGKHKARGGCGRAALWRYAQWQESPRRSSAVHSSVEARALLRCERDAEKRRRSVLDNLAPLPPEPPLQRMPPASLHFGARVAQPAGARQLANDHHALFGLSDHGDRMERRLAGDAVDGDELIKRAEPRSGAVGQRLGRGRSLGDRVHDSTLWKVVPQRNANPCGRGLLLDLHLLHIGARRRVGWAAVLWCRATL